VRIMITKVLRFKVLKDFDFYNIDTEEPRKLEVGKEYMVENQYKGKDGYPCLVGTRIGASPYLWRFLRDNQYFKAIQIFKKEAEMIDPLPTVTKIYVVTGGSHEDYSILAIFDNRQFAEDYVSEYRMAKDYLYNAGVEEWLMNEQIGVKCLPTYRCDINIVTGQITTYCFRGLIKKEDIKIDESRPGFIVVISAKSQDHAVKIATEKRQERLDQQVTCAHEWHKGPLDFSLPMFPVTCWKCGKRGTVKNTTEEERKRLWYGSDDPVIDESRVEYDR
jgi:hypothetical protein